MIMIKTEINLFKINKNNTICLDWFNPSCLFESTCNKKDDNKPLLEMQKFTYKILLDTMITDNLLWSWP